LIHYISQKRKLQRGHASMALVIQNIIRSAEKILSTLICVSGNTLVTWDTFLTMLGYKWTASPTFIFQTSFKYCLSKRILSKQGIRH